MDRLAATRQTGTYVHFIGGDKIKVEGSPDEIQERLTHGAMWTKLQDGVVVRGEAVSHLTEARSGVASF